MKLMTQISRIFVGVLFIISGFIKANDTTGFSYKLIEYFEIFGWDNWVPFSQSISMLVCIFEILCGVALLLGALARLNAWLLMLMIVFFTLLTGYSAITGAVTDCGCFGDAIKLKPVGSFIKDLVLLFFIIFIFVGVKHIKPLFRNSVQLWILFASTCFATLFTVYTYMFLPIVDFLPYKVGNDIKALSSYPEGAPKDEYEMIFIYEKDGVRYDFTVNNLPDDLDAYNFIDRKDKLIKAGYKPLIYGFKPESDFGEDYTDSILNNPAYQLILVQTKLVEGRAGTEKFLVELATQWTKEESRKFWAFSSSSRSEIEEYRHENQLPYQYYTLDATPLKSMIRSNPGLMLLKGSVVVKKWSAYNLPTIDEVNSFVK